MAVIETKFGVGDAVWSASIKTETRSHPCPDCLGSRKWGAKSPAGGTFSFECPRCASVYQANQDLNLSYAWWVPTAERRTIGQVRAYSGPDGKNEYMCHETGIGSGSLYYEDTLFLTKEEAMAAAQLKADANNANPEGWVAKQYSGSLKVCDYQLRDAAMEGAISAARESRYRVGYLLEDLEQAGSLDEVKDQIASWREDT